MPSVKRSKEVNMRPLTAKLSQGMLKAKLVPSLSQPNIGSPPSKMEFIHETPDLLHGGPSIESHMSVKLPAIV